MWELDHQEGWALKNWCFQTVLLEKTLQSPLDCKEIKPLNPKGNQPRIFIGRTDAKAETPVLWLLTHWKTPWCWERLRAREGGNRGWDGWIASLIQWTWAWVNSGRWGRIRKPSVLQSNWLQRVGHDLANKQQQIGRMKFGGRIRGSV